MSGGEGEIRTPGTLSGTLAFEASAIDHSATSPTPVLYREYRILIEWAVHAGGSSAGFECRS
jgi:hypothetical protein